MRADRIVKGIASVLLTVIVGACSFAPIEKNIERDKESLASAQAMIDAQKQRSVVVRNGMAKLAGSEAPVKAEEKLPRVFDKQMTYMRTPSPLPVVLGEIGRYAGYPIKLQGVPSELSFGSGGMPGSMPGQMPQMSPGMAAQAQLISVDWNGSLRGLLDHIAMRSGLYWKFSNGSILFYKTETKTYHVSLPQGLRKLSATVAMNGTTGSSSSGSSGSASGGTTGGSGGSSGTNTLSVDTTYDVDAYEAIKQGIYSILEQPYQAPSGVAQPTGGATPVPVMIPPMNGAQQSGPQSYVAVNPALGTVTVTAEPPQLERVEQYIKSINDRFAQNVLIDLKVYSVDVAEGVNAGASLLAAYQQSAGKYNFTITGNPALQPNSGTPGTLVLNYTNPASRWLGSQITLQALKQLGDVTLRTSGQVLAANGQPTPLQVANEITYLASSTTSVAGTGGTTMTALNPGVKTVGLTANFLPMVLADNRILLQYQINLSSLLGLDTISSGGSTIQTPRTAVQSLQQQAYVRDGETIVLFGFEQDRNDLKTEVGLGGASRNGERKRSMIVIVMEVYSGK